MESPAGYVGIQSWISVISMLYVVVETSQAHVNGGAIHQLVRDKAEMLDMSLQRKFVDVTYRHIDN